MDQNQKGIKRILLIFSKKDFNKLKREKEKKKRTWENYILEEVSKK
jgi:hypothetical protein